MDQHAVNGHINTGFKLNDLQENGQESKQEEELVKIEFPSVNGSVNHEEHTVSNGKAFQTKKDLEDPKNDSKLIYKLSDTPPVHLTLLFALQQVLMSLPGCVIVSILVARSVCAGEDEQIKAQLLSTTIFMSALTTFFQVTLGIRLSVYQGPTAAYLIPILALSSLPEWKCPAHNQTDLINITDIENSSRVSDVEYREANILPRMQLLQGSLIFAGTVHMLIGLTGLIGILLRYLGPITVIPTLLLLGIEFYHVVTKLCEAHWAVSIGTAVIGMTFAVYLEGWQMPIPIWTKSKGFHIIRYPLQQVLAILLSMGIGWLICGILTSTGVLTNNPDKKEYKTRTDSGLDVIAKTPWFYMPYPGQFGPINFSAGIFIGFLTAVVTSIIDSIADYYACARMCHVPPPPVHAVNRGIMIEGLMSIVSGFYGTGHGTTTYGGNIGCIGITKVASRRVYQVFSIVLLVFSVCGKVGAVFVTIPDPVLGGTTIVGFGIFIGLILANLQYVDLNSSRNLAVLGVSILVGLMIPNWTKHNSELINTGSEDIDRLLRIILTNPTIFGGGVAFFLDNTVKGSKKERGLLAWDSATVMKSEKKTMTMWEEDSSVYEIVSISKRLKSISVLRYIPIMPNFDPELFRCN